MMNIWLKEDEMFRKEKKDRLEFYLGGVLLMRRRKRPKDWHHRVPDFKLVYCGRKKNVIPKRKQVTSLRTKKLRLHLFQIRITKQAVIWKNRKTWFDP
jgi:hypothetical protein